MLQNGLLLAERYEIQQQIGVGGMAYVYRAKDIKLNRFVAIKVLKEDLCKDKSFIAKFQMEAQAAAGLSHANIVGVYDVGEAENTHYIVMELIEGITLKEYIQRKTKLDVKETIGVAIQVAEGLEAAHASHLIHRDIKPQNIIISREGKIKVTDFGIARAITDETTNLYKAAGSVHYISPEQARGGYCDERSDIYSLGITMYEMVTGRVPFDGETTVAVAIAHMNDAIVPPSQYEPSVPLALEQIIFKCVQKKPDRRYSSCRELITDLRQAIMTPQAGFVHFAPVREDDTPIISEEEVERQLQDDKAQGITADTIKIASFSGNGMTRQPEREHKDLSKNNVSNPNIKKKENTQMTGQRRQGEEPRRNVSSSVKNNRRPIQPPPQEMPEKKDRPANWFDHMLIVLGSIFGVAILAMVAYLVVSISGILSNGNSVQNSSSSSTAENAAKTSEEETDQEETITKAEDLAEVPKLLGLTIENARTLVEEQGLVFAISKKYENSDEYTEGLICKQQYEAGTKLSKGSTVTVTLSIGSDKYYLEKDKYINVNKNLLELDLASYKEIEVEWIATESDVKKGTILSLDPEEGYIAPGEKLTVYYSKGPTKVEMTDLRGMTKAQAESELSKLGLELAAVNEVYNNDYDAGQVCAQSFGVGQTVNVGSSVTIEISKGMAPVSVPSVLWMSEADARAVIDSHNLTYQLNYVEDSSAAGTVIAQDIPAETVVNAWTTITLTVSTGPAQTAPTVPSVPPSDGTGGIQIGVEDVTGMTLDQAIQYVTGYGLNYVIDYQYHQWGIPEGMAVRLEIPNNGINLQPGDTVKIFISLGPPQ